MPDLYGAAVLNVAEQSSEFAVLKLSDSGHLYVREYAVQHEREAKPITPDVAEDPEPIFMRSNMIDFRLMNFRPVFDGKCVCVCVCVCVC